MIKLNSLDKDKLLFTIKAEILSGLIAVILYLVIVLLLNNHYNKFFFYKSFIVGLLIHSLYFFSYSIILQRFIISQNVKKFKIENFILYFVEFFFLIFINIFSKLSLISLVLGIVLFHLSMNFNIMFLSNKKEVNGEE